MISLFKRKNKVPPQIRDCKEYNQGLKTLQDLVKVFIVFRSVPIFSSQRLVASSHLANSILNLCKAMRTVSPDDMAVVRVQRIAEKYLKEVLK
jgi:hypothetical protein